MMEAYSVPCAPETSARTGPGFAPRTTATGIEVAASTPAGTSRKPVAFCPGAAVALPTVKLACAIAPAEPSAKRRATSEIIVRYFIAPRVYGSHRHAGHDFLYRDAALSISMKFLSAQLQTDWKMGWRLRPSFVTEYSTRGGI